MRNTGSVLLGTGDGTFGSATNYAVGSRPFAIAAADLDRDSAPDLVVANSVSRTVSVLLNTELKVGSQESEVRSKK